MSKPDAPSALGLDFQRLVFYIWRRGVLAFALQLSPFTCFYGIVLAKQNKFMVVIELNQVRLHAFHGIYEGEKLTGSEYEINVRVVYEEGDSTFDDLKNTINYVEILDIVKQRMRIPTGLLEKVADSIIRKIKHRYPFSSEISISIYKLDAPVENFQGKLGVTLLKKFDG
ncbi:dihydroneopterin aldolase [Niastella yeongjuensis]|nr:dihydroneopterin aldolase [Niastella yeongjuensis]SEO00744.1 dihydroneopterin aldolase [Niastella yeongjuensis]